MWVVTRVHPSLFAEICVTEVSDRSYLNMGTELAVNNAVLCFEFISDIRIKMLVPSDPRAAAGIFNHLCLLCTGKEKISHILQALALTGKNSLELLYFDFIKMVQCMGKTFPFFFFVFLGQSINAWPGTHYVVQVGFKLRASLLLLPPKYWESHHVHSLFQTFKLRIIAVPLSSFHEGNAAVSLLRVVFSGAAG